MSLFSLFKKKQETPPDADSGEFRSRAESDTKPTRGRSKRSEGAKKNQADDPILPEKKRARRRLIGAVALVLAAVIGLPMILDSEPKPLADDINIQIPSKDKPLNSNAADKENAEALAAASTGQQAPRADGKTAAVVANVAKNTAKNLEPSEEIVDPATLGSKGKPAAREAAAVAPAAAAKPAAHTEKETSPEHRVEAKPPVAAKSAEKNGAGNAVAATEQKNTAAKPAGKAGDTFDDSARALAILEGKSPAKAAGKPSGDAAKADKASSGFVVQVAALATQEKVDELQGKLNSAGIKSYTQKVTTSTGKIIRIRVGPFDSKEDADKMHAKLAKLGLNGTLVPN
ncbi:MAG: SPOR domain-containing protein [Pseudomonadota bacterium]